MLNNQSHTKIKVELFLTLSKKVTKGIFQNTRTGITA